MRRTMIAAVAAAAVSAPGWAGAEEHEVLMFDDTYFPQIVHAAPGDTVRFVNGSDVETGATATDQSWTTGPVPPSAEAVVPVTAGMTKDFNNAPPPVEGETAPTDPDGTEIAGVLEWEAPAPVYLGVDGEPVEGAVAPDEDTAIE